MRGHPEVIELLNDVLTAELTAVNQYYGHAKMQENWGYEHLAARTRHESIDEMRHADEVIERILYLDGMPNLQRLGSVQLGETVVEQLRLDADLERAALTRFNEGIAKAVALGDNGTRELLAKMLVSEEDHLDWLETQLSLVEDLGEELYLSQQVRD
jgi:bacterioferritin